MLEARSAIAGPLARGGRDGADGRRRLRLGERRGWHLVQLGHYAVTAPAFEAAVRGVLGHELPHSPREAHHAGPDVVMRVAPDQYWLLTADAGRTAALASAVPGDVGSVLPLSASRTCIVVDGSDARTLLAKLVPLDLHPAAFAVGCFAQTGMHHVGGLLYRAGADRYEYLALRTYAATMWEAIADAALPFGYEITIEGVPA
jgi:heterotetrameric sarcosine oxidase gamma subunit